MKTMMILLSMTAVAVAGEQPASPVVRGAISALYVASDGAQREVDASVCGDEPVRWMMLDRETKRQVRHVIDALEAAYDLTDGSDEALEMVHAEFCEWAGER